MDDASGIDRGTLARQIAADVDRAAPLLARILLVRAISRLDIWVANDMVRDCGRAGKLAVADATTLRLAQVLAPPYVFGGDLTTAIAAVEQLASAMWREQRSFQTYLGVTDPELGRDDQRVERAGRTWEDARHRVSGAIRHLPAKLGDGMVGSLLLDRALDRTFRRGFYYEIRHYRLAREPERVWRRQVAKELLGPARTAMKRGGAAPMESLADTLRAGGRALVEAQPSSWARMVAGRLEEAAVPVFTGQEALTPEKATAIRLAALCLAHEPDAGSADAYRAVFAGVTRLELAASAGSTTGDTSEG